MPERPLRARNRAKLPPGFSKAPKLTVESIKRGSRGLRANLCASLRDGTNHFDEVDRQILKFHGVYQQDDRDRRQADRHHIFMIRSRIPGGQLTAEQYLVHDELADRFGNGTLRVTTRQGLQLHSVLKQDLKEAIAEINESLVTTLAACGDVARNLMYTPVPPSEPFHFEILDIARQLSEHLLPKTRAYHEIWLDGERVDSSVAKVEPDPIYGETYLPRKFKVGIAFPGDNSIDVYSQDVGLVAVVRNGQLIGFNVLAGGGLGMTHNKSETYPRLADPIGFATVERVVDVVEAIVLIQRDHGDRNNRRRARLKYLVDDWGVDRFRSALFERLGYELPEPVDVPPLELELYLGWSRQHDGRWYLGIYIENGRIGGPLKAGLRDIVARFRPGIRLTPNQNVLLTDIEPRDRAAIDALLAGLGITDVDQISPLRQLAMACPALPTCGLALAEAERAMPDLLDALETEIQKLDLQEERIGVRMTGCPNGCARPYLSEIGIVGRSPGRYALFLGGTSSGTRLNKPFRDLVPIDEIVPTLRTVLSIYKAQRVPGESLGDFCLRFGVTDIDDHIKELESDAQPA